MKTSKIGWVLRMFLAAGVWYFASFKPSIEHDRATVDLSLAWWLLAFIIAALVVRRWVLPIGVVPRALTAQLAACYLGGVAWRAWGLMGKVFEPGVLLWFMTGVHAPGGTMGLLMQVLQVVLPLLVVLVVFQLAMARRSIEPAGVDQSMQ